MENKSGSVSIDTENIFPIIKKWLYSEKDIFIREIVSNAGDAISKLKKLANVGEATVDTESNPYKIEVILDEDNGTITVHDNGIGMTEEEVEKYINQIAFSGAKDFIEKYQGKTDGDQIIGHFGLGFYSAFMVSSEVEIDTLSFVPGSKAVHWDSKDGMSYEISDSDLDERGTYVTMHIGDDGKEYLKESEMRQVLDKYFSFFPVEIYLIDAKKAAEEEKKAAEEPKEVEVAEDGKETEAADKKEEPKAAPKPINDTTPLWLKPAKDCTDEEYKEFYHKTFNDYEDPLFWIHLNVDYPFNLKGILYFPKIKDRYERYEGQIKVYYNQVFVADNIKEILPEYLLLLKGAIDCPDLPLNVSRSFLQNDGYVNKISQHITKKVADKLNGLFKTDRDNYCKYWDDINPFVKFGCIRDEKLYDKIKDSLVYKSTDGKYYTFPEYQEKYKDKTDGKTVYYTDDTTVQAQYIKMLEKADTGVVVLDGPIDVPFMQFIEYKNTDKVKFARIDSGVVNSMKNEASEDEKTGMTALSEKYAKVFKDATANEKLKVSVEKLNSTMPAIILLSEEGRRMQDFAKQYGDALNYTKYIEEEMSIVLNYNSAIIKALANMDPDSADAKLYCSQVYDIALLAHKPMDTDAISKFIERSEKILSKAMGCEIQAEEPAAEEKADTVSETAPEAAPENAEKAADENSNAENQ